MLHCYMKSKLTTILEQLPLNAVPSLNQIAPSKVIVNTAESGVEVAKHSVKLVDAMATIQSMGKPEWIKNCSQLVEHFISCVFQRYYSGCI